MKHLLGISLVLASGAVSAIATHSPGQTPCVGPIPLIDETVKIMATPVSIQLEGDRCGTSVGDQDFVIRKSIQYISANNSIPTLSLKFQSAKEPRK